MTEKGQMKKNQASSCTLAANIKHVCHEVEKTQQTSETFE